MFSQTLTSGHSQAPGRVGREDGRQWAMGPVQPNTGGKGCVSPSGHPRRLQPRGRPWGSFFGPGAGQGSPQMGVTSLPWVRGYCP